MGNTLNIKKSTLLSETYDNLLNGKANGRVQWSLTKFFVLNHGSDEIVI